MAHLKAVSEIGNGQDVSTLLGSILMFLLHSSKGLFFL